jgi:DNA-binding CsgD family transcriptional regulator
MDHPRLEQLSDRQKDCLRLVYQNYNAKQIGRKLDISPNTVNRHLQDARSLLGVSRSMDVAIMLVEHEGGNRITTERIGISASVDTKQDAMAVAPGSSGTTPRNRYHLTILQRAALIAFIAFLAVALAGALLTGSEAINKFFWGHQIDISDPPYRK